MSLSRKWPGNHEVGDILLFQVSKKNFAKIPTFFQLTDPEKLPSACTGVG